MTEHLLLVLDADDLTWPTRITLETHGKHALLILPDGLRLIVLSSTKPMGYPLRLR